MILQSSTLALFLLTTGCVAVLPDNYQSLSAKDKQTLQWNQIVASQHDVNSLPTVYPAPGSNLTFLTIPTYLETTFLWRSDEMPDDRRRIVIAPFGVVAKIIFRTTRYTPSYFTGLFDTGGIGIIRLALDGAHLLNSTENFDISTATKIYIDGDWSQNFPQIKDLGGQAPDHNYFRDNMSNIIDTTLFDLTNPVVIAFNEMVPILPGDALARPFNSGNLGQYEQAEVNSDGSRVSRPIAPWETIFVPNPALAIPSNSTNDFRLDIIQRVKPGTVIYTVYGRRTVNSTESEHIGEIVCDSEFISSAYGDTVLFFRHPSLQWRP